jgi:hypothetical protein
MNRMTVLVALVKGMLRGDKLCTEVWRSADYRTVLDSIEADSAQNEEAAFDQPRAAGETLELLIRPQKTDVLDLLSRLKLWLRGAKRVIVCDPYFFQPVTKHSLFKSYEDYAERLLRLFDPDTKNIRIFCDRFNDGTKKAICEPLKEGRSVEVFSSRAIHDRFIIKDDRYGKMIGASMQGFGGKIFAVLDLPEEDVAQLLSLLHQIPNTSKRL